MFNKKLVLVFGILVFGSQASDVAQARKIYLQSKLNNLIKDQQKLLQLKLRFGDLYVHVNKPVGFALSRIQEDIADINIKLKYRRDADVICNKFLLARARRGRILAEMRVARAGAGSK